MYVPPVVICLILSMHARFYGQNKNDLLTNLFKYATVVLLAFVR